MTPGGLREQAHANGVRTWHFDLDGPDVLAAVTTRHGGRSAGPYRGLDLAFHVGDDPGAVAENRALVCEALDVPSLTVPDQRHGRAVAVVDAASAGAGHRSQADAEATLPATDALVTDLPGVALAILVADCAPIVLYDPARRALGVAHAGRRGVVLDVVGATVGVLAERFGSAPADLLVGVGPCIGAESYELGGPELAETRAALGDDLLTTTRPGHARFDLPGAVLRRLGEAGVAVEQIQTAGVDTLAADADLFSHRAERPCGRFALVAALRPVPAT
jgi:YfiH family protein